MGHPWKAQAFVSTVSFIPSALLVFAYSRHSIVWSGVFAVLGAYIWVNYSYPFFTDPLRQLPHPPTTSFILSNGLALMHSPPGQLWAKWFRSIPNDGLIYLRGFLHTRRFLLVTSTDAIREILLDKPYDFAKPRRTLEFLSRILGDGLIIVEGYEHKLQRKLVAPAFHGQHIHELIPVFWQKAQELSSTLATHLTQRDESDSRYGIVEMNAVSSRVTLDIIGVAGLGRDFRTLQNSDDELASQYEFITNPKLVNLYVAHMTLPSWIVEYLPWPKNHRFKTALVGLHRNAFNLLNEKRAALNQSSEGHKDILTILLQSKTTLSDPQLTAQLLTFLAAGHETTSSALAWAMYLLAHDARCQEKLRHDIRNHRTRASGLGSAEDLKVIDSIPYLQAVCNETLRLYPTVPNTMRTTVRPTSILGLPVAVDTNVVISMWAINRHPAFWGPDADEFRPERWLEGGNASSGGASSPYTFLTFLHGPRSCIGQGFARTELRYLLAALLLCFRWELADLKEDIVPAGAITIKPLNGLRVKLTEL